MHLTKRRRLSFRIGIAYSEALARVPERWLPPLLLFSLSLSLSLSSFFCLWIFPRTNETATRHWRSIISAIRGWHKVVEEDVSGFLARKEDPLLSYRSSILFVSPIPMQETVSNSANKASPSPRFPNLLYLLYSVYPYCCSCSLGFIMSNDIRQWNVIAGNFEFSAREKLRTFFFDHEKQGISIENTLLIQTI